MSESLSYEEQEDFIYKVATQRYLDTDFEGYDGDYRTSRWLQKCIDNPRIYYDFVDQFRKEVKRQLSGLNRNPNPGNVSRRVNFNNRALCANEPNLVIARDVVTHLAVEYFKNLYDYLKARETDEQEIDEIRQEVSASAHLLLRQLERAVPNFSLDERIEKVRDYIRPNLKLLIDFDRVSRETGLINTFTVSDLKNFEAIASEEGSLGVTQNTYSGLRPIDILCNLNDLEDVSLHEQGKSSDSKPFMVINADGTVDIDLEREVLLETGLDMAIEEISDKEQEELAKKIAFSAQASSYETVNLTRETLEQNGLLPKWIVRFGDTTIYLTDKLFREESEKKQRPKTIIYIKDEEKGIVARPCYKSYSQVVWRLLPAYSGSWYNKANGEEQLTLTPELQRALSYLCQTEQMKEAEVIFYGATKQGGSLAKSFQAETKCEPVTLGQGFFKEVSLSKPRKVDPKNPESFKFDDEEDKPDFSNLIDSWTEEVDFCGVVTFELFESKNGRLRYLFCRDKRDRAWIPGIDLKDAKMTSQGIKEQWVCGGDLCTPVFEYWEQADGYGNHNYGAGEDRQYTDMYENYLRPIPLIQEYQASVAGRAA